MRSYTSSAWHRNHSVVTLESHPSLQSVSPVLSLPQVPVPFWGHVPGVSKSKSSPTPVPFPFVPHQPPTRTGNLRVTFDSSLSLEPQYPDSCCILWIYLHVFLFPPPSEGAFLCLAAFTHVMTLMFNSGPSQKCWLWDH